MDMLQLREAVIQEWFDMWRNGRDSGIRDIFAADCVYVESWGPCYMGVGRIVHWFQEWNTRGRVTAWKVKQFFHREDQTAVEWYFRCEMSDGTVRAFDGMSLVRWTRENQISFLKEFGCNRSNYDPYERGEEPCFREESPMWF